MKPLVNNQELFKAIAEGKEIQYCIGNAGEWKEYNINFFYGNIQYRIKPKKIKKWRWIFQSTDGTTYLVTDGYYKDPEDYNNKYPSTSYKLIQPILETEMEVEE